MEYFIDHTGQRQPIPDAIVAASEARELVHEYMTASETDRAHLHKLAIEATTPNVAAAESFAAPTESEAVRHLEAAAHEPAPAPASAS